MTNPRMIRLDCGKPTHIFYVVGTELDVDINRSAPPRSKYFSVKGSPNVNFNLQPLSHLSLSGDTVLSVTLKHASQYENDSKLSVWYYGVEEGVLGTAILHITAVEISLDVDADRDGQVEKNNPNKGSWTWGPNGQGAILLVNCDSEDTRNKLKEPDTELSQVFGESDLKDMSLMKLRTTGPMLPDGYKLTIHISEEAAQCVRVFMAEVTQKDTKYPLVLNSGNLSREVPYLGGTAEMDFYVEGLRFPDKDFDGFVPINLSVVVAISPGSSETIFTDTVVFRVAPWIMTPNTLQPRVVYVCRMQVLDNSKFIDEMISLAESTNVKLEVMEVHDLWMQDEMEFGYVDSPHQRFPVVLHSPRERIPREFRTYFPYVKKLLGQDFGYKELKAERVTSLDGFGNLEVSPPVEVKGKKYPLGRIIIGANHDSRPYARNMAKEIPDFLEAQRVQKPIHLFTDWLIAGHVDEFMTFVPAPDRKGFRLLLASPDAAYKLFRGLQDDGHGHAKLLDGKEGETTVENVLMDQSLKKANETAQMNIDWNKGALKRELGLEDEDIVHVPVLFRWFQLKVLPKNDQEKMDEKRLEAFYPNLVNMIVLGKSLGVPKPFGPQVNGGCALEAEMISLMRELGLTCTFIYDFVPYHQNFGNVHCGSNIRREPSHFKWWNMDL